MAIPRVIAGVEMRPFCLGHHLLLKLLGIPFAGNADADCGPEDVVSGIAVCGLSYETALAAIHGGELPDIIARWRKAVSGPWWRPAVLDMVAVENEFRAYLRDGYMRPPVWSSGGAGCVQFSAPWEELLKVRLVRAGLSEADVLAGYLPARWYDYHTLDELEAAESCRNPKQWRGVFFTQRDAEAFQ